MAERRIENSQTSGYFLWIDPLGGTDYDNVVCLNDFNFNMANSTVNSSTMCGSVSAPGDKTVSIGVNGLIMLDVDTGRISAPEIFDLTNNQTVFSWMIGKLVPVAGDFTKTGNGYFSNYTETYSASAPTAFTNTIQVDGNVLQVVEAGS